MPSSPPPSASKPSIQLNKMREANAKYKSLLKMAKERIQAQEEEIESLRGTQSIVIPLSLLSCEISCCFLNHIALTIHSLQ